MRAYQIGETGGIDCLECVERPEPEPGPGEVLVRIEAASLNYRDLLTVERGTGRAGQRLVPFSDGAGEIAAVGAGVGRFSVGDKVCPLFFPGWLAGGPSAMARGLALGGTIDGVLQDYLVLSEDGVSPYPRHFSALEAATLPCAALTAWRALVVEGAIKAGDTVLVEGTGGVSIFALQIAKMSGAKAIVTSSSEEKMGRAKALGADHVINYRAHPEWGRKVMEITEGRGVDIVVEVGGAETFPQAVRATRVGGAIILIGVLSGGTQEIALGQIFTRNLKVIGISVGSRAQFEDMSRGFEAAGLQPVIDKVFPFSEVPDALGLMKAGGHLGKICIDFTK